MVRYAIGLAAVILSSYVDLQSAEARRVALVIGNAAYKVGPLANPMNDAAAVAKTLESQLKFDKVILRKNLGLDGFRAALREMAQEALGAEYGVIYFAGHGMELAGRNYLIPTDAMLTAARDIELEAIGLDTVLGQLDGARKLKLVILDACRNNPFPVAGAKRSVTRGLTRIEPEGNTLVAYAAKDGTTADDGKGLHSPFTAALLKRIATPGLDVRRMFGYVSDDVLAATNRTQEPYLYGRIGGEEVFLHPQAPTSPAAVPVAPVPLQQLSEAERVWGAVKDTTSIDALEAFRRQHGASNPVYDRLAEARIALLKEEDRKRAAPERVRPDSVVAKATPQAIPVPQPEVLLILVRSAIIALDHANRTGDYAVLRQLGAPALQQHSAAQLSAAFANLRAAKVNLLTAAVLTPQLTQQPKVAPEGLLQLVGFFPTQPQRIQFNIVYQAAGGEWRLAGLNVALAAAPQAEAKTPPADAKAKAAPAKKDAAKK